MDTNNKDDQYTWSERESGAVNANTDAGIDPGAIIINGENIFIGRARIEKDVKLATAESGKIIIEDNVIIENNVELSAGDNEQIVIGEGTRLIKGPDTCITGQVTIGKNCEISGFVNNSVVGDDSKLYYRPLVKWSQIGAGVSIKSSELKGYRPKPDEAAENESESAENYVIIKDKVSIDKAVILTVPEKAGWSFIKNHDEAKKQAEEYIEKNDNSLRNYSVKSHQSIIGEETTIMPGSRIVNSRVGTSVEIQSNAFIEHSIIENNASILRNAIITRTRLGEKARIGCEISKSWLSAGVIAVHTSSYVSAIIPEHYVIINEQNDFEVIQCPNLTNISAGVVFANSSGTPTQDLSSTQKGTAFVWSTFFGVNSNVINLYDHPKVSMKYIFREENLSLICPFCLIKGEVWGLIPPFTYADALSPTSHKIGWVLNHNAGQIVEDRRRMKAMFGDRPEILEASDRLIEGTIRLGIRLVRPLRQIAQRKINSLSAKMQQNVSRYTYGAIDRGNKTKTDHHKIERGKWSRRLSSIENGLKIYQHHLKSGVWKMKDGEFIKEGWHEVGGRWTHRALSSGNARFL